MGSKVEAAVLGARVLLTLLIAASECLCRALDRELPPRVPRLDASSISGTWWPGLVLPTAPSEKR